MLVLIHHLKTLVITYNVFTNFLPTNSSFDNGYAAINVTATDITAYDIEYKY